MFELFVGELCRTESVRILDLGVTSEDDHPESNYLERWYPHPAQIVCAGTQDARVLEERHPGVRFVRIEADRPLPFADREFDVVFSNAVVEHVGNTDAQGRFVREALRVARAFFITTPNRWFPVELHTGLPLLHYFPAGLYRPAYRALGFGAYGSEETLNLLDARQLRRLFPPAVVVQIRAVRLLGLCSNLIAMGTLGPA
jgi:SAM-dependent methyltransferase